MSKLGISLLPMLLSTGLFAQAPGAPDMDAAAVPALNPVVEDPVQLEITEWEVPWPDSRPRDPDVAPNGVIWLVGQGGDYAARFDPETERFRRRDLPQGTGPHNLIIDADGTIWIAGNRQAFIGKMNYVTGNLTRYAMPGDAARDPHTLVFAGENHIWFTVQWGNMIGRLDKRNGRVDLVPLPVEKARPYGIRMDSRGNPWVALLGTNALATVNPKTMQARLVMLPREGARLRRLAVTHDDAVWYTDYNHGYIGRYDPESGEIEEWRTPGEQSGPYAMAADQLGRVWFVETWVQPNRLVGFDPLFKTFFSVTDIPSGGGAVRHMVYDPNRNALWFGTDTNMLARAQLPD